MTLITYPNFPTQHITPRQIEIWLPPSYHTQPEKTYPVLYMHDAQNLFNPATSTHGITWGIDEALTRLIAENGVQEPIVVGVWNGGSGRWQEYLPQRPYDQHPDPAPILARHGQTLNGPIESDNYLRFLVEELKPYIDQTYRTQPEQQSTTIMGSSMGGLISLYAICEYPEVFSAAGCVSTHWPAVEGVILPYLRHHLPNPTTHRLYFDYGTEALDALYEPLQQQADAVMREKGYTQPANWVTHRFAGADHSEQAWRERVHLPLTFLLNASESEA